MTKWERQMATNAEHHIVCEMCGEHADIHVTEIKNGKPVKRSFCPKHVPADSTEHHAVVSGSSIALMLDRWKMDFVAKLEAQQKSLAEADLSAEEKAIAQIKLASMIAKYKL